MQLVNGAGIDHKHGDFKCSGQCHGHDADADADADGVVKK